MQTCKLLQWPTAHRLSAYALCRGFHWTLYKQCLCEHLPSFLFSFLEFHQLVPQDMWESKLQTWTGCTCFPIRPLTLMSLTCARDIHAQQITKHLMREKATQLKRLDWIKEIGGALGFSRPWQDGSTQCLASRGFSFSTFSLSVPSLSPFCAKTRKKWTGAIDWVHSFNSVFLSDL